MENKMDVSNLNYSGEDFGDAYLNATVKKLTPEQLIKAQRAALAEWLSKNRNMTTQEIAKMVNDAYPIASF